MEDKGRTGQPCQVQTWQHGNVMVMERYLFATRLSISRGLQHVPVACTALCESGKGGRSVGVHVTDAVV